MTSCWTVKSERCRRAGWSSAHSTAASTGALGTKPRVCSGNRKGNRSDRSVGLWREGEEAYSVFAKAECRDCLSHRPIAQCRVFASHSVPKCREELRHPSVSQLQILCCSTLLPPSRAGCDESERRASADVGSLHGDLQQHVQSAERGTDSRLWQLPPRRRRRSLQTTRRRRVQGLRQSGMGYGRIYAGQAGGVWNGLGEGGVL